MNVVLRSTRIWNACIYLNKFNLHSRRRRRRHDTLSWKVLQMHAENATVMALKSIWARDETESEKWKH